jgi:hypothetical protein
MVILSTGLEENNYTRVPIGENMQLIKQLPKIAARILHSTRTIRSDMKFKFELIADAYGTAVVVSDFEKWCEANIDSQLKHPIYEYLKVIDSRLGVIPETQRPNSNDPKVAELRSITYELTGVLPAASAVAELVLKFEIDEIKAALIEYTDAIEGNEIKSMVRAFYSSGGGEAIILARRRRTINAG